MGGYYIKIYEKTKNHKRNVQKLIDKNFYENIIN